MGYNYGSIQCFHYLNISDNVINAFFHKLDLKDYILLITEAVKL